MSGPAERGKGYWSAVKRSHASRTRRFESELHCLHPLGIMVDIDRLQIRVQVERLRSGLAPTRTRLPEPAKRHVRLAPVRTPVHHGHAALNPSEKCHRTMDVLRMNR